MEVMLAALSESTPAETGKWETLKEKCRPATMAFVSAWTLPMASSATCNKYCPVCYGHNDKCVIECDVGVVQRLKDHAHACKELQETGQEEKSSSLPSKKSKQTNLPFGSAPSVWSIFIPLSPFRDFTEKEVSPS